MEGKAETGWPTAWVAGWVGWCLGTGLLSQSLSGHEICECFLGSRSGLCRGERQGAIILSLVHYGNWRDYETTTYKDQGRVSPTPGRVSQRPTQNLWGTSAGSMKIPQESSAWALTICQIYARLLDTYPDGTDPERAKPAYNRSSTRKSSPVL